VAVGPGVIATRSEGTWTPAARSETLNDVAHTGIGFVAVGYEGVILTSTDGTTWASPVSGTGSTLYSVNAIDGRIVAVGSGGTILVSTDGSTWVAEDSGTSNSLRGVAARKGLAVGGNGTILHRGLFADGFELGTTDAWSTTVGG
jgi:hypothetical protein